MNDISLTFGNTASREEIREIVEKMITTREFRRVVTRESFVLFFGAYFGKYIRYPFADFHREMFRMAEDETLSTIVIMGARGSAKSTIMNTALAIWSALGKPGKHCIVILSETQIKAKKHFMNVKDELSRNELLKNTLGPLKEGEAEWGSFLTIPKYDAQITFASLDQGIRGLKYKQYRPDLIIADDIEDDDSVRTAEGRDKTYNQLVANVISAGDASTRLVLLGTMLDEDSVMMRFKRDIEAKVRAGVFREYPLMDAGGNVLWKGKYPDAAAVEAERLRIGNEKAWLQEFLLRIVSDADQVVHLEWIHYEEAPARTVANYYRGAFIGIDPAISEDKRAAYTAMVVILVFGWGENTRLYVQPYPVNERMAWPDTIKKAKALSDEYRATKVYVEDFGMQRGIAQELMNAGCPAEYLRPAGDKRARVVLISHHIKNGTIRFAPRGNEELVMQMVNFGREHFVDLVDAFTLTVPEIMTTQPGYRPFPASLVPKRPETGEDDDYGGYNITRGLRNKIF